MNVTVCQLTNSPDALEQEWKALATHVHKQSSDFVLLPEMPFHRWLARKQTADASVWKAAVDAHERWLTRLPDLAPATVAGTRPVLVDGQPYNEGFVWHPDSGYRRAHTKYYLPDEAGFWEASWYRRGHGGFALIEVGGLKIGFLICTELWFTGHARDYARQGIHLLLCPRATPLSSAGKWVVGGRAAAVVSGAFCLSSNLSGEVTDSIEFGGTGWVVAPEEGDVLGLTSAQQPFLTTAIDPSEADAAKKTHPRYVRD